MITFKDVQISFHDFIAIPKLNLTIHRGEFFTLLGPSGCGKTTTLRSLAGFVTPSQGSIFIEGKEITQLPIEKREIGMVFQSYALFPTLNVYDNIAFGLKVKKNRPADIEKRVLEVAEMVDLKRAQLAKKVSNLSGGQQQRVAIARALALSPKILVMDEPLSNLDAKLRKHLRKELKRLQTTYGITTIYVTHDQEEALTLSDRIAVFNKGRIEQVGTPEEIYNRSETEFVCNFIGEANLISDELKTLINRGVPQIMPEENAWYIRNEKIRTRIPDNGSADEYMTLTGKVISKEFYGTYSCYQYQVGDSFLFNIEKEDGSFGKTRDENVQLFIHPDDLLYY